MASGAGRFFSLFRRVLPDCRAARRLPGRPGRRSTCAGSLCLLCLRLQSLRAVCAEDLDAVLRLGECDQIIDRCDILGQLLKERVGSGLLAVCPDSLEICLAGGLRLRASGRSRDKLLYFFDCFLFCHKKILLILHWGAE